MSIKLNGTLGSVSLDAPSDTSPSGTDVTLTLPTSAGNANQFLKNSGTAGTLEYSSMVEDSSGNVGIGTSTPITTLHVDGSGNQNSRISSTTHGNFIQVGCISGSTYHEYKSVYRLVDTDNGERMRIDGSGNVGIGTTSLGGYRLHVTSDGGTTVNIRRDTSTGGLIDFNFGASGVGNISTNGSTTSYNTSSDYRLKENVVDLDGAISRVKQLAPKRFNFIADAETTVDGFLAHEAQAVVPEAVTGTHDQVDDDGNPVYQGIDQSKLVPLLTAALQEAIAKIETLEAQNASLEARLTALEGGAS